MENPCDNCKFKNIDWRKIEEFKDSDSNPMCNGCYKKECYEQSLKPTHKVIVELADNEVLVKHTIKDEDMQYFIGRTTELSNYVCGTPMEVNKIQADAVFEDSIYSVLQDVETTFSVVDAPMKVEKYLDGEYHETYLRYIGDKVEKIVNGFFK